MKWPVSVHLSLCPSLKFYLVTVSCFFLIFCILTDNCKISKLIELDFSTKKKNNFFFFPQNGQNGPKMGFLQICQTFCHHFFLDLVLRESSYYQLCACTNLISRKILVLEFWATMLVANDIAGFLNQPYLKKKLLVSQPGFLACRHRLENHKKWFVEFLVGNARKCSQPIRYQPIRCGIGLQRNTLTRTQKFYIKFRCSVVATSTYQGKSNDCLSKKNKLKWIMQLLCPNNNFEIGIQVISISVSVCEIYWIFSKKR